MSQYEHASELLPWQTREFEQMAGLAEGGKLAHAYLLGGQQGLGKLTFAEHFAHYLLCQTSESDRPCGHCRECQLFNAGTHPDLKIIQPEDSSEIRIEQIRACINFVTQTSQRGGYKVVIFCPAEAMNVNSANALLKVLEEPADRTLLMLVSHQPGMLMATIRSRCHMLKFSRPPVDMVIPWLQSKNIHSSAEELLKMANYVPLRALQYADDDAIHDRTVLHSILGKLLSGNIDIASAAAECLPFGIEENIDGMLLCTADILIHSQTPPGSAYSVLHDHDLESLADYFRNSARLKALHNFYNELLAARRVIKSSNNPNPSLVMESLFYNWSKFTELAG